MDQIRESLKEIFTEAAPELVPPGFEGVEYNDVPKYFWVVMTPTENSELNDIAFRTDLWSLHLQLLGGLNHQDVVAIYGDKISALNRGQELLKGGRNEETN